MVRSNVRNFEITSKDKKGLLEFNSNERIHSLNGLRNFNNKSDRKQGGNKALDRNKVTKL